ncbi:MAG: tRNA pseudouridine(13) synthase TruD [Planctomycetota bacterium]|nr:tRNA pseudouridine(13) synthase TruD [Planctomycetota bacterium]
MHYLTEELPGTGGRIKAQPDDFVVTEVPLYEPCGEGDHVYLYVEKQGLGSLEAAEQIARALGRPRAAVGLAGLKDAQALTRQWMSLERVDADLAARLRIPSIKILEVRRHRNKLKIGHLAGNRFDIRIRGCRPGARETAEQVLAILAARGVPNRFDRQRFGRRGDNHLLGRALVLGQYKEFCDQFLGRPSTTGDSPRLAQARHLYDTGSRHEAVGLFKGSPDHQRVLAALVRTRDPKKAAESLPKQLARLLVGALQSDIFNAVLERRLDSFDRVEAGDMAYIHPRLPAAGTAVAEAPDSPTERGPRGGAVFLVERPENEAPRAARFEISPSGPIIANKVTLASGRPGEIERAVFAEKGIAPADFEQVKALRLRGDRRPLRVLLGNPEVEPVSDDIRVRFVLPSGAYATVVLAEITKF